MKSRSKLGVAVGVLAALYIADGAYAGFRKAYRDHFVKVKNDAIEKTVDDFVTAVVTCKTVTIESKHHGRATVQLVTDN
jgi:hypothetical protein